MRLLELAISTALIAYLMWLAFGNGLTTSGFRFLPFVAVVLLLVHLLYEGGRWPMIPIYALTVAAGGLYPWCYSHDFRFRLTHIGIGAVVVLLLLGAALVAGGILRPVFAFAPLTGPYAVGVMSAHLTDGSRRDPYAVTRSDPRELMVEIWYPAEEGTGAGRAYYRDAMKNGYNESSLSLVRTRARRDAAIAREQSAYPVLLFTGPINRFQNTFETEELASQGFIVVGMDHPYDSGLVVFPDGRRISASKEAGLLDFTSEATLASSRQRVERRLAIRVADALFVLDQLKKWNQDDPAGKLFGHLDLDRIGIIGHSFGGAVAAELCRVDGRVRAGVNMDGSIFGEVKYAGVPKPFFFMFDTTPRPGKADLESNDAEKRKAARELEEDFEDIDRSMDRYGGYFLQVPGLEHMNYTDFPLYSQVKAWTGAGAIDIRRAHRMTNDLTLAFFRRELLMDSSVSLQAVAQNYPEARLIEHPVPVH